MAALPIADLPNGNVMGHGSAKQVKMRASNAPHNKQTPSPDRFGAGLGAQRRIVVAPAATSQCCRVRHRVHSELLHKHIPAASTMKHRGKIMVRFLHVRETMQLEGSVLSFVHFENSDTLFAGFQAASRDQQRPDTEFAALLVPPLLFAARRQNTTERGEISHARPHMVPAGPLLTVLHRCSQLCAHAA